MVGIPCKIHGKSREVSREAVLSAMRTFDQNRASSPVTGKRYFVWFNRKKYPPKMILSLATNTPRASFTGGEFTNQIFRDLGFLVATTKKDEELRSFERHRSRMDFKKRVPSLSGLVQRIFDQKWSRLVSNFRREKDGEYPGLYLLAYCSTNLAGRKVEVGDIFYVGMSTTALSTRLNQFCKGIRHLPAQRLFSYGT